MDVKIGFTAISYVVHPVVLGEYYQLSHLTGYVDSVSYLLKCSIPCPV